VNKEPILLSSVPKETIWGGHRLKRNYNKTAPFDRIAESWELTLRADGENTASDGIFNSLRLSEIIGEQKISFLGTSSVGIDRFPLLIKFIDAQDNLSIQIHPDDEYALLHENELGKTEMWYIVEANEGASLVLGLKDGYSISDFAECVRNNSVESILNYVPVKKGDVYFIPPGTVHAIGSGILIAEIQQNSNVTYRVYDYNRTQPDGTFRTLHAAKALDVMMQRTDREIRQLQFSKEPPSPSLLCSCDYFRVEKYTGGSNRIIVSEESFAHLLFLDAKNAEMRWNDALYPVSKGDSWFLPAGIGIVEVIGEAEFLVTTLPKA